MSKLIRKWQIIDAACSQCGCAISKYRTYVTKGPVFCSRQCYGAYKTAKVDADMEYVKSNIGSLKMAAMATHLNITEGCLEKRMRHWRDRGLLGEPRQAKAVVLPFFSCHYPEQMLVG